MNQDDVTIPFSAWQGRAKVWCVVFYLQNSTTPLVVGWYCDQEHASDVRLFMERFTDEYKKAAEDRNREAVARAEGLLTQVWPDSVRFVWSGEYAVLALPAGNHAPWPSAV